MPTNDTLDRFIARVEQNAHVEAVEEFYATGSSMQENQSPPRVGRDKHIVAERNVMSREELAYQRWEGERIAEETFFYDPAQRVPKRVQP
jgi:hypothetical protein